MTSIPSPDDAPRLYAGGIAVDDRGSLSFVNDLDLSGIQRFYIVRNHRRGFVRAWHAHRREAKYVSVTRGAALVGAVKIDDWDAPSIDAQVHRHVLSAEAPGALYIPPGYANGFMSLSEDATMLFFSTASLAESRGDDVRFDARRWNIWDVVER